MFFRKIWLLACLGLNLTVCAVRADDTNAPTGPKIDWIVGPTRASLKDIAELQVPEGFRLANPKDTRALLERMGNPTSGAELGFLIPDSKDWFVVFEFMPTGYIKDDDKDKLDADAMLKSIREGTEQANQRRRKMGSPELHVTGWAQPPKYNLEWAVSAESEGSPVVNYNTRILGRKGVMEVNLVVEPDKLAATMPAYKAALKNYDFKMGEKYAEYRAGDKVAKYGLAALVTGGAAVVAVKTGLFAGLILFLKKGWKLVAVGIAACVSFIKKLFTGKSTPKPTPAPPTWEKPSSEE